MLHHFPRNSQKNSIFQTEDFDAYSRIYSERTTLGSWNGKLKEILEKLSLTVQKLNIQKENWEVAVKRANREPNKSPFWPYEKQLNKLLRLTATPGHPSSCSLFGDLLGEDFPEMVQEFHRQHYVASKMFLSVESSDSLDKMQKLVIQFFSGIPASNGQEVEVPVALVFDHQNAFRSNFVGKTFHMETKKDESLLFLTWCLPSFSQKYRCKPQEYVTMLLENVRPGGLASYLKKHYLATQVFTQTQPKTPSSRYSTFVLD